MKNSKPRILGKIGYFILAFFSVAPSLSWAAENGSLEAEALSHLRWCDSSYHQDSTCPGYGLVRPPAAVAAQQKQERKAVCEASAGQGPGCDDSHFLKKVWQAVASSPHELKKMLAPRAEAPLGDKKTIFELAVWCQNTRYHARRCKVFDPMDFNSEARLALSGFTEEDRRRAQSEATRKPTRFEQWVAGYPAPSEKPQETASEPAGPVRVSAIEAQ